MWATGRTERLSLASILVGVIVGLLGAALAWPWVEIVGALLLGSGLILGGAQSLTTRRAVFLSELGGSRYRRGYSGRSAVVWGLLFLLVGLAVLVSVAGDLVGQPGFVQSYVQAHPSLLLLAIGLGLLAMGLPAAASTPEDDISLLSRLESAPRRIIGLVGIVLGLLALIVAVIGLLAPLVLGDWVRQTLPN